MFDAGATNGHGNRIDYTDVAAMDAPTAFTAAFWVKLKTASGPAGALFSKLKTSDNSGWSFEVVGSTSPAWALRLLIGNGSSIAAVNATEALTAGTMYHYVVTWDGTNAQFFRNTVSVGLKTLTRTCSANTATVSLGNRPASTTLGGSFDFGQVMWWNVKLTDDEIAALYGGEIPQGTALKFWVPGWATGQEEILSQLTPTMTGTVTVIEDTPVTVAYPLRSNSNVPRTFSNLLKIINETLNDTEGILNFLGETKIINETVQSADSGTGTLNVLASQTVQIINESLNILADKDSNNADPDGVLKDTQGAVVWSQVFPPFHRRTKWTVV